MKFVLERSEIDTVHVNVDEDDNQAAERSVALLDPIGSHFSHNALCMGLVVTQEVHWGW